MRVWLSGVCLMCEHVLGVWRLLGCLQLKQFSSQRVQIMFDDPPSNESGQIELQKHDH